jgi:hypothetical protein
MTRVPTSSAKNLVASECIRQRRVRANIGRSGAEERISRSEIKITKPCVVAPSQGSHGLTRPPVAYSRVRPCTTFTTALKRAGIRLSHSRSNAFCVMPYHPLLAPDRPRSEARPDFLRRNRRSTLRVISATERRMSMETILIIVLLILLLGGGGWYGRGRWYGRDRYGRGPL